LHHYQQIKGKSTEVVKHKALQSVPQCNSKYRVKDPCLQSRTR